MKPIFDTHCHPYLNKEKETDTIISNFFMNGGKYMTIVGTNPNSNQIAINIANKNKGIYCSVGIHPCDVYDLNYEKVFFELENDIIVNKNKVIAIGECGLDYYRIYKDSELNNLDIEFRNNIIESKKKIQKLFFKAQILLATRYNLPLIIHNREAKNDVFEILQEFNCKNFIFHCYSENLEFANKLIHFAPECKISFSGMITFNSAKEIQYTAQNIDIKHILVETDSPYLTPVPYRGKEENEPIFTKHIINKINNLRGTDCSEIIFQNSLDIFNIK